MSEINLDDFPDLSEDYIEQQAEDLHKSPKLMQRRSMQRKRRTQCCGNQVCQTLS